MALMVSLMTNIILSFSKSNIFLQKTSSLLFIGKSHNIFLQADRFDKKYYVIK